MSVGFDVGQSQHAPFDCLNNSVAIDVVKYGTGHDKK